MEMGMENYDYEVDDVEEVPKQPMNSLTAKDPGSQRPAPKTEQNFFSRGYWINDQLGSRYKESSLESKKLSFANMITRKNREMIL